MHVHTNDVVISQSNTTLSGTLRPQGMFPGYYSIARCDEAPTYSKNMGLNPS